MGQYWQKQIIIVLDLRFEKSFQMELLNKAL